MFLQLEKERTMTTDDDDYWWEARAKVRASYYPGIEFIRDQYQFEDVHTGYPLGYWGF